LRILLHYHDAGLPLDTLGELLEKKCQGRIIHLGSCATLRTHGAHLNSLLSWTGALAVCGYTSNVDWVTAAAFDLILFDNMQERAFSRSGAQLILRDVKSTAPGLLRQLGFRMKVRLQ